MFKVLVINGPNLNLLGLREPDIYGRTTYADLVEQLTSYRSTVLQIMCMQSNHEGEIVDAIQEARTTVEAIVINPAAYTHTSVAILDALKAVQLPTVEVHISDPDTREEFRHHSFVRYYAEKTIKGHGIQGYFEAIDYLYEAYAPSKLCQANGIDKES